MTLIGRALPATAAATFAATDIRVRIRIANSVGYVESVQEKP